MVGMMSDVPTCSRCDRPMVALSNLGMRMMDECHIRQRMTMSAPYLPNADPVPVDSPPDTLDEYARRIGKHMVGWLDDNDFPLIAEIVERNRHDPAVISNVVEDLKRIMVVEGPEGFGRCIRPNPPCRHCGGPDGS